MFNLKTAIKGAAAGFVISFIAGIIGRVDFLIILLRAFLSAVFSGALFGGLGVLYNAFLGGARGSDFDVSPTVSKTSPAGSVVDITLTDDELPDSDTAPDFALSPDVKLFDTPSAIPQRSDISEPSAVLKAEETLQGEPVQPVEPPAERQSVKAEVFEPIALGGKASAVSAGAQAAEVSEVSVSSGTDDVITASESPETAESILDAGEEGTLIDNLPDMDGFAADQEYFEEDNDDTFGAVSPRGPASHTSSADNPVDISDAKNIADAIRTALKKES